METNKIENEIEMEINKSNGSESRKKIMILASIGFLVAASLAVFYVYLSQSRVYVETAYVEAPSIDLSSETGGVLQKIYVNEGDSVAENEVVAQVGQELVKSKEAGTIIKVNNDIGKTFMLGEAVVTMIRPDDLRIVAQAEENKGLNQIQVGQRAFFTVDAFGGQEFEGVVDEVSPTSRDSDVVFNISDQREVKQFNVKISYDVAKYPQLKNGMSAKAWIYKN